MNGILKMTKFYYVSAYGSNCKVIIVFTIISVVSALVGVPAGCMAFCLAPAFFAAPEQYDAKENRRIFGILPIKRSDVIRGEFLGIIASVIVGQIPSVIFLWLSSKRFLLDKLPESLYYLFSNLNVPFSLRNIANIALFAAFICVAYSLLNMVYKIHGTGSAIKFFVTVAMICLAIYIATILLSVNGIIELPDLFEIYFSNGECIFMIIIFNILSVVTSVLCCERIVTKTAKYEL